MNGQAPPRPSWGKRARRLLAGLGLGLVFVLSLPVAAVLHLDLPATRRAVLGLLDGGLDAALRGEVSFAELERLDAFGVRLRDIQVRDPSERLVLRAEQLEIDFDLFGVVHRFLRFFEKLSIEVDDVRIEGVDLTLYDTEERDESGQRLNYPSLADAFSSREPSSSSSSEGRAVRVWFSNLSLRRVFVSSRLESLPALQGQLEDARGTLLVTDKGLALDVSKLKLAASGLAGADLGAEGELHLRAPGALWGKLAGHVGTIPVEEDFRVERGRVQLRGVLPSLEPAAVRGIWPSWPLDRTIGLEHDVSGVPPRLDLQARVRAERGDAQVRGVITVSPEFEADLDVDTERLDLSALRGEWPRSELNLRSVAEVWSSDGRPRLELNATLLPSRVLDNDVPPIDFVGTYDERGVLLSATLHERGLPLHLSLEVPDGAPPAFEFELRKTVLEESPRLTALSGARGVVQGTVSGRLEEDRIVARSALRGAQLSLAGAYVDALELSGTAEVPLSEPLGAALGLRAEARGVRVGELRLTRARADVVGPLERPRVTLQADGQDGARVELLATTRTDALDVDDARLAVLGRGKPIEVRWAHVGYHDGRLIVREFHLESEGRLDAELELSRQGGRVHVDGSNLNMERLAEAAGLPRSTIAGRLTTRIDAELGAESEGNAEIHVSGGEFAGVRGVDLSIATGLSGRTSSGHFDVELADVGHASGEWKGLLAGHPFSPRSFVEATGSASVTVDEFDLSLLSTLLPRDTHELRSGNLTAHLELSRLRPGELPRVEATLDTNGLSLEVTRAGEPLRLDGVDLHAVCSLDPDADSVQLVARADDFAGDLVSVSGSFGLPLSEWGDRPPPLDQLSDVLWDAPAELVLAFPRRRFDDYPPALGLPSLSGQLAGRGSLRGTLRDPALQLTWSAERLSGKNVGLAGEIDAESTLRYRPVAGQLNGDLRVRHQGNQVAASTFDVLLPWTHFTAELPLDAPAWTGRIQLVLDGTPLGMVDRLAKQEVTGELQGAITLERSQLMPSLLADLRVRRLGARSRRLGEGTVMAQIHGERLVLKTDFDDDYGKLSASAEVGLRADPWLVLPEERLPWYATLRAEKYDAAVFSPFLDSVVSELSGSLNGTLRVELRPPEAPERPRVVRFSGQMRVGEATLTPRAMGLRLEDASFDLNAGPEGSLNVLRLTNIQARARSGEPNVFGSATLYFEDLSLLRGQFDVRTGNFPLLADGVKLADLSGEARGQIGSADGRMLVTLELPRLNVELPRSTDRELIELTDNPTIDILQPVRKPDERTSSVETPTIWQIDVELGSAVRVNNQNISLLLSGKPRATYGDKLSVEGEIALSPGGRIQVLGRVFVIDHGLVAFDTEDVSNPHLDVTATWRAPSGVLVRATVGGTAHRPELKWSSDPPLPGGEAAIIATVMGSSQGADSSGVSIAYGAAALNQVLGETGVRGLEIYASRQSDSSNKGQVARLSERTWDSYTAAYQVSDQLWFEGSYKQETAGPGITPRAGFSGTLDWRFDPAWSLRTEVGTLGLGTDLLWQYRY